MGFWGPSNVLTLQDGMPTVGLCRFNYCEFTLKQWQLEEIFELLRRVFWSGCFAPTFSRSRSARLSPQAERILWMESHAWFRPIADLASKGGSLCTSRIAEFR